MGRELVLSVKNRKVGSVVGGEWVGGSWVRGEFGEEGSGRVM